MLKKLDYLGYKETVVDGKQTCVLFITREDNCSVCRKVEPKLENLSEEYEDLPFYVMDVYDAQAVLMDHHLKSLPQVIYFDEGEFHLNIPGDATEDDFALKAEYLLYYKK